MAILHPLDEEMITSPEILYLLDDYAKISLNDIRESTQFFCMSWQEYHIQNLEWTELFL